MPLVDGDIVRTSARMKNTVSGDVVNVFHWLVTGTSTVADDTLMTAIETKLSAMYATIASHLWSGQDPYDIRHDLVQWIAGKETVVRTLGTRTWTLTTPPSGSTDTLPQQDAAIINFRTAVPKTFGRKYIGALMEGDNNGGVLNSGMLTALAAFAAELLTDFAAGGTHSLSAGILSYKALSGNHWVDFLAGVVNSITGTQRRRRAQRGS